MEKSKSRIISLSVSLLILVGALVFMICDWAIPIGLWTHPLLNFFAFLCVGFGITSIVFAFLRKSPWFFFLSGGLIALAGLYISIQYLVWWIAVIIFVFVFVVVALLSLMVAGNKTESIALNDSPDYKDYKARKFEKNSEAKETEELPEIKSFK